MMDILLYFITVYFLKNGANSFVNSIVIILNFVKQKGAREIPR